jgi:hypothetical protein
MSAGFRLGALFGLLAGAASAVLDPAAAGIVIFGPIAVQAAWSTSMIYRRTPFRNIAGASALGAVACAVVAMASLGHPDGASGVLRGEPWLIALLLTAPAALFADSRLHPQAWRAWSDAVERASLLDILACRSVPVLRG